MKSRPISRNDVDIPIYSTKEYDYILLNDMIDKQDKEKLEKYLSGQTRPLVELDDGTFHLDAVFLHDYLNFLNAKRGGFVLWD